MKIFLVAYERICFNPDRIFYTTIQAQNKTVAWLLARKKLPDTFHILACEEEDKI